MKGTVEGYVAYVLAHQTISEQTCRICPPVASNDGWIPMEAGDRTRVVEILSERHIVAKWDGCDLLVRKPRACHWCPAPATGFDDFGEYCCRDHGIHSDRPEPAKPNRYRVTTKWWELVEPPRWIAAFWFTEMIWNLSIHHSCSLTSYHDAENSWLAQAMAYEFVDKYPWSDRLKYRILVGRARLIS